MNLLGKSLVLANLALSVILATIAIGVYGNHIDWTNSKAAGGSSAGLLTQRTDRIKQLSDAIVLAENRYQDARSQLFAAEDLRGQMRRLFNNEFDHILTKADAANPIHQIVASGQVAASNPAGGPLVSRDK